MLFVKRFVVIPVALTASCTLWRSENLSREPKTAPSFGPSHWLPLFIDMLLTFRGAVIGHTNASVLLLLKQEPVGRTPAAAHVSVFHLKDLCLTLLGRKR